MSKYSEAIVIPLCSIESVRCRHKIQLGEQERLAERSLKITFNALLYQLFLAKDIGDVIWNTSKAKLDEDNYEDIKDVMNKAQDELEIHVHDGLPKKTQSFLINMSRSRATMLCGPSFSGKSTIISVNITIFA